ncbi:MAG: DUF2283 domain-containing protein [bacterium]|nr:DUF2283 domain-containing protein [bacterium]
MAKRNVKVWYDPEADFIEVTFTEGPGYYRETANDQVMERVDDSGNIIGFSIIKVSSLKPRPLEFELV